MHKPSRNTITVTVYGRHCEIEWHFPMRWEICCSCDGHGTTTRHIECDGGGFTASEWREACDDDPGDCDEPGFADKYFGGYYDRPCPDCDGLGRAKVIDEDQITGWRDKIAYAALQRKSQYDAEYASMSAYERRIGA